MTGPGGIQCWGYAASSWCFALSLTLFSMKLVSIWETFNKLVSIGFTWFDWRYLALWESRYKSGDVLIILGLCGNWRGQGIAVSIAAFIHEPLRVVCDRISCWRSSRCYATRRSTSDFRSGTPTRWVTRLSHGSHTVLTPFGGTDRHAMWLLVCISFC